MRSVWILTVAQAFAACGTITLVAFGGIVGTRLAPQAILATLPLSLSVLGVASTSLPAALLMQRIGRKPAFIASLMCAVVAALGSAWSVAHGNFWALCLAAFFIGSNMAFVQQYRFAATEFVAPALAGKAISTVMIGTLAAAFIAPVLGETVRNLGGWPEFSASFLVLAGLLVIAILVLLQLPATPPLVPASRLESNVSLSSIIKRPDYRVAVTCGIVSYAVMSFIMTATPLSMHVHDGLSSGQTASVITAHLLAMYLPSLATPFFLQRLGLRWMIFIGVAANLLCILISTVIEHAFVHYFVGLVLLGLGWNFIFVAATTLLTSTYSTAERFRAQGFNDFAVFGTQAIASLLAGTAIETIGWQALNLATVPFLAVVLWQVHRLKVPIP